MNISIKKDMLGGKMSENLCMKFMDELSQILKQHPKILENIPRKEKSMAGSLNANPFIPNSLKLSALTQNGK